MSVVTCIAPVNIAVIKYWGKRDDILNLPINDSISGTLDTEHLCAKTTVMISPDFKEDMMWLNGSEQTMGNRRLQNCLQEMKKRSQLAEEMKNWKIHICSENNFPTAAGLASSAAGYACLAATLAKLYKVEGDISGVARVGSGSACRSVYGGFVRWYMGSDPQGCDSIAKPIVPASHWPEMRILILVVSDSQKKVPSTAGMRSGVLTSKFLKNRAENIIPARVEEMYNAIADKNFELFAELTMKDSNNMHAACLDTYPPCVYMNDVSHLIVDLVHTYNAISDGTKVAYTFDAGPNATLYLLEKDVAEFTGVLNYYFPPREDVDVEYNKGISVEPVRPSEATLEKLNLTKHLPGKLKYIIHTRIGDGPKQLNDKNSHLLNEQDSVKNEEVLKNTEPIINLEQSTDSTSVTTLSKRQLKKIKKREKWLKLKPEKRLKERAKAKEKRAFARAHNLDLGPSRKFLKTCTMADSPCKLNVTIDLSFDDHMISKDIAKLIKQILRCYTLNRRAVAPVQFSLCSFEGKSFEEMGKHNGYEHWDVKFYPDSYLDVFPKDKLVYLTSESENVIEELNHDHIYVIGGLVDHNQHKGLCHKLAVDNGLKHGRLPLDKFLKMKARKVLTVDHVFEIILRVTEGKTWQEAFLQVLPERKNAQLVHDADTTNSSESQTETETEQMKTETS